MNVLGFFNPLVALLDQAVNEGFLRAQHRDLLLVSDSSEGAIDAMLASLGGEGSTDLVQI